MSFCFVISINAQDKLYVNLWYGKVKNENVEKHLELEKILLKVPQGKNQEW